MDEKQGANWLSPGRTYSEAHFSPLTQINTDTVRRLGLAWFLDLPGQRSLQATPLAVDGMLYFSGANGKTFAVDARLHRIQWEFDPDLALHPPDKRGLLFGSNRGVAFWRGKVYVGTVDGRLVALDATSGRVVWSTQTFDEGSTGRTISGAPRAFNGKVIIGHSGESGVRGYVTAYDAETGQKLWRFHTVPGDPAEGFESTAMARAAKSWHGKWWKLGGNAAVWDNIAFDPDLNRIYVGTANGTPFNATERGAGGGDNLFISSIIAIDADTGHYIWHYQVNPGDTWDFDATQQTVLANLTLCGQRRKVLMVAPKNGFFYVIDRHSGKLISAQKITKATWADHIDLKTGRPVETLGSRYTTGPVSVWPSIFGAHDWQRMSFSPATGLVYVPIMKLGMRIGPAPLFGPLPWDLTPKDPDDGSGYLVAWDSVKQSKRWEVHYADSLWNGGILSTAGNLVFQGTASGRFVAYDAGTGQSLWTFYPGLGVNAAPMTYELDGVQYISVLVGYGGGINSGNVRDQGWRFNEQPRRLLTFALGGRTPLPLGSPPRFTVEPVDDPTLIIDAHQAARGHSLSSRCLGCHGINLENHASMAPDLRESVLALNWEAFRAVLHEGILAGSGMPKFDDMTDEELRAIYLYIRKAAREAAK